MSFWDHLEVLRWSVVRVFIVILVFLVAWFAMLPHIFNSFILGPTSSNFFLYRHLSRLSGLAGFLPDLGNEDFNVEIINIHVTSQFMTHISTSFCLAFVCAFPYLVYEVWRFISPALYESESKRFKIAFAGGTVMFYLGCTVGYTIVFPFTFRFLTEYQLTEAIVNQISLNSYMDNFFLLILMMGVVFELPMVIWMLTRLGLVNKDFLKKYRRHAVVVLLVVAAFITPTGDPFTLMIVFVPLYLLYEFGIILANR